MGVRETTKNAKIAKVRLGDVATQIRGVSYKPKDAREDAADGYTSLLRANNIANGVINHDELVYVRKECVRESQLLVHGDILICASSGSKALVGKAALIRSGCADTFGAFCKAVRPNIERVGCEYLAQYFQSDIYRKTISNAAAGANINNIRSSDIDALQIPLPPLPEQKRIAEELDRICELKKNAEERLALMDQLVKSRFVEMFGDVTLNDRSYEVRALRDLGKWSSGGTPSRAHKEYFEGAIDWYSAGELNDFYLKPSKEKISEEALRESSAKLWPAGSLLVGMYDTAAFKMGYLDKPASSNQACACLMPTVDMEIRWLYCMLQAKKESFLSFRHGCRQKNLSLSQIKEFEIPFPPLALQREFAAFVDEVDKSKYVLRETIAQMETLYRAKLQEYFG